MQKIRTGKNRVAMILIAFYLVIILAVSYAASYFAYQQRRGELLAQLDLTLLRAANEYADITDDFWALYMPVFEGANAGYATLKTYFADNPAGDITPLEKYDLRNLMNQMAARDDKVQWIAAISGTRATNYIYYVGQNTLQPLDADFPYTERIKTKSAFMEIYGAQTISGAGESFDSLAIAGGLPEGIRNGSFVVGYDAGPLRQICGSKTELSTLRFDMVAEGQTVFSTADTPLPLPGGLQSGGSGVYTINGQKRYLCASGNTPKGTLICYSVAWGELFLLSHRNTPGILLVVLALVAFSLLLYGLILRMLAREVNVIQTGLEKIGQNQLDYRITGDFKQENFQEIADSINTMTENLKENVDRAHEYERKQQEAEMQELQAKFNPHFLYNSLEMFRARCYQNGDEDTAELIAQTASIFRGFIGSRTFIPITEELAFSKRYLVLFRARYGDAVRVLYDIDTEVLQYGIIRNVFQPIIENYFVHGIDTASDENYIRFKGCIRDENTILITVEDNGAGMPPDELQKLNETLHAPIATEKESYGLKNLHQRLHLFYGEGCGLTLRAHEGGGLAIDMVIRRRKCDPEADDKPGAGGPGRPAQQQN